jgi:PST family polysaccharide transporter
MSSKISDACTKAAGEVYIRAMLQVAFAAMVVVGALVGQRWGVGGVAIAVSAAMGINFLSMAGLSRTVTGLPWPRFGRAHVPGILLAASIGAAASLAALVGRAAHWGNVPILIAALLAAAAVAYGASRLWPELFLGPHGTWAFQGAHELIRRRSPGTASPEIGPDDLASAGEAGS